MTEGIKPISCTIYPAVPPKLSRLLDQGCKVRQQGAVIALENDYLTVEISGKSGVIKSVINKTAGQKYSLTDDQVGFDVTIGDSDEIFKWIARQDKEHSFDVKLNQTPEVSNVALTTKAKGLIITITYLIQRNQFWLERQIAVESGPRQIEFDRLVYGKLDVAGGSLRILELGKFDRPLLVSVDDGGVFGGVGWWFYSVDSNGVYHNSDMAYTVRRRFESEPWYLGVFGAEADEPFPGWLWYKNFLRMRKIDYDKQLSWCYWNAGWGQWGIDINDASAQPYIELAHRLGVRGIAFGSGGAGLGISKYIELASTNTVVKENLALLKKNDIATGFLENGGLGEKWKDTKILDAKLEQLNKFVNAGYRALHFDFFSTIDTFTAHRNVAKYFQAARDKLDYTECHLGMADYGPQFQREVLINHPTDLHGFDISHFSSDWATFLGFRHSRAEWQKRYHYLMPEYGLYYFLSHYSNWGHTRLYTDPEPQQFLYRPHAYCGIAYNFHDTIGFREVIAAAAAFSPYYVFGHLELKLPARDAKFALNYLKWVAENADVLRLCRICLENDDICVISKLRDGKGAIFVLNYNPGRRGFKMKLDIGSETTIRIRQIYPVREYSFEIRDGEFIEVNVRGESAIILDVNNGFKTLPPENASAFPIDVANWEKCESGCYANFIMPDIRQILARNKELSVPKELLSLEQQIERVDPTVEWLGRGKLPGQFLKLYGFSDNKIVETWKFAPWVFAQRVWLVYRPAKPLPLDETLPTVQINGKIVSLIPRVDYRPEKTEDWKCPMFFADVTDVCKYGQNNSVIFSDLNEEWPSSCYVISAVDRY